MGIVDHVGGAALEGEFQEVQYFPVFVLFASVIVFHLLDLCRRIPLMTSLIICVLLIPVFLLIFQLKTVIDEQAIRIQLGWIPLNQHIIPLDEVIDEKLITFKPLDNLLAFNRNKISAPVFVPRRSQGLVLQLKDGSRHLMRSRRIRDLQQAVKRGRQQGEHAVSAAHTTNARLTVCAVSDDYWNPYSTSCSDYFVTVAEAGMLSPLVPLPAINRWFREKSLDLKSFVRRGVDNLRHISVTIKEEITKPVKESHVGTIASRRFGDE